MKAGTIRWTFYLAALLIVGPLAGSLMARLYAPDGGRDASPLVSTSPGLGLALGIGVLLLALVLGALAARFCGAKPGLSTAGVVVAWAAWRTGTIDQMIRTAHSGGPLTRQAAEGALLGALGIAVVLVITAAGASHREPNEPSLPTGEYRFAPSLKRASAGFAASFRPPAVIALPFAILAGAVVAGLVAATPLKGQAVFAATFGAVAAAAAGRLAYDEVSFPFLYLSVAMLAVAGPLTGLTAGGGLAVVKASYANTLFPLANITAMDWIAGALLGVPLGVAWAGSMVEKRASATA
jgi:hypothetical protein